MTFQKLLLSLFVGLCLTFSSTAQTWQELREQGANYYDIERAFEREHAGKVSKFKREMAKEAAKGDEAKRAGAYERQMEGMVNFYRWQYHVAPRVRESQGDMTAMSEGMLRGLQQKSRELNTRAANWSLVGPQSVPTNGGNGRINAVRVHPTNSSILFACSPAGGLWKSTNGGTSWTTITDAIAAVGATDVAFNPTNPNIMYLATGDGDASDVLSLGVYKSIDGGNTWAATSLAFTLANGRTLSKILVNPTDPNIVMAGGRAGIYRSTNAGSTWTQVSTANIRDLEFKPNNPSVLYAGGYAGAGFLRSTDGGITWVKNTTSMATGIQRIAVAVSPLNANYVYCLAATTGTYGFEGLYLSTDGGTTFTKKSSTPNILGWYNGTASQSDAADGQGWYDLCLAVSPTNINTILTGGVNIWRSTNGGTSWSKLTAWEANTTATNYSHADVHDLTYAGTTLYAGSDGGVFISTNDGTAWANRSANMSIAQLYGLALSPTSATTILSGHQDNGTNLTTNGTSWAQVNGGDGMLCMIDQATPTRMFSTIYNGALYRSTNSGASFSGIYTVPGGGWVTPILQDKVTPTTLYAGGTNVVKSINSGTNWTTISAFSGVGTLVSMSIARNNSQIIAAASATRVMVTTNGGSTWTNRTTGLPANTSIQGIEIDVNDANKIYVALASYAGNSVFRSLDGGATWANISAGLPSIPAECFVTQNNATGVVYVGTDLGVYYSANSGTTWTAFNTGMPGLVIKDLEIFYPTGKLRAATYGRGVWESTLEGFVVNNAPSVAIASPANGSSYTAPASVVINANAADTDGSITKVDFYNGATLLFSDNAAPYSYTWTGVAAGSYALTARATDNLGATTTSSVVNISVVVANDAGISAITTPTGTISTASFTPSVTLRNFGSATLTSVQILTKVDAGAEVTFNWTGSLASNATTVVMLPAVTGYTAASHTYSARTQSPNGLTDGNAANNALTSSFTYTVASACSNDNETANNTATGAVVLAVNSTKNSQIGSAGDLDFYKFTTTTAAPKVKITLTNLPLDYDVRLYAATATGGLGSQIGISQNSATVAETIVYNTATKGATYYVRVNGYNNVSSTTACYTLGVSTSSTNFMRPMASRVVSEKDVEVSQSLSVFPNPTRDVANLNFKAWSETMYTIHVLDITGKEILRENAQFTEGGNQWTLKTDNLQSGLYFIRVENGDQDEVTKLMIEK
jgi:Bacterial Ig domain/Secretion system C-terminal sorting domain